ncbi:MAG: PKD domain-containing protein [Candidatus Diapherotrites archaeon]
MKSVITLFFFILLFSFAFAGTPTATIGSGGTKGQAPFTVQLLGVGIDVGEDGTSMTMQWNFGDGSTSTEWNPKHTYTSAGTYAATFTVTDSGGNSDSEQITITVSPAGTPPQISYKYVTPTATGSGNGTQGSPWTVAQAYTLAQPGDIVLFADGYYDVSGNTRITVSGTPSAPITYKAQNPRGAVLDGKFLNMPISGMNVSNIIIDGFEAKNAISTYSGGGNLSGGAIMFYFGSNIVIKNCLIHDAHHQENAGGIKVNSVNNVLIENCEIYDVYYPVTAGSYLQDTAGTFQAGIFTMSGGGYGNPGNGLNIIIRNNLIYNVNDGIWFKNGDYGPAWVYNNKITSVLIGVWARLQNTRVFQNIIIGDPAKNQSNGLGIGNSNWPLENSFFYNNTLINPPYGINIDYAISPQIYNNIVYTPTVITGLGEAQWGAIRYNNVTTLISNYNDLFQNPVGTIGYADYSTLAQWRTATGQDMQSISADPLFVNAAAGDYRLQPTSPARGTGQGGVNMGAYIIGNEVIGLLDGSTPPACTNNQQQSCSTGLPGICSAGTRTCTNQTWGACEQNQQATAEVCDDSGSLDEDCDGESNCNDSDCFSAPNCQQGTGFAKIDFGTGSSPVMAEWTNYSASAYSSSIGFGWENTSSIFTRDRGTGNNMERDLHQTTVTKNFLVDVPNGAYTVTLYFYDSAFSHNGMNLSLEGTQVINNLQLSAGTKSTQTFNASVNDGQLTIGFSGCETGGCIINGLEVIGSGSSCTENWSCTQWSSCSNGTQTRTCTDSAGCGTTTNKPAETQSCSLPGAGVIFEDDFEGWHDQTGSGDDVICNPSNSITACRPEGSEWCRLTNWPNYGLPDTQILNYGGRLNSNSMAFNTESRVAPAGGITGWLPEKNHDELYFRWYMKYDETWSWWPNQNGQKLARIGWNSDTSVACPSLEEHIIPGWVWGRMAYRIAPGTGSIYSSPEVCLTDLETCTKNYGFGNWISLETYVKLNTVGQSDGILTSWMNGRKVLNSNEVILRTSDVHINRINFPDNIIYTNQPGSSAVPWLPPEEKPMWLDDFVISTNYIGPEECPNGTEITMENVGTCYCGTSTPNPACSATNTAACTGIVESGYCCSGSWQTTSCTPAIQCTVNIATPCTISIAGGTINSCSQQNLIYQYNTTSPVNHAVNGLQASKAYDIKIENTTTGTTQNKTANSNDSGVLQFGS